MEAFVMEIERKSLTTGKSIILRLEIHTDLVKFSDIVTAIVEEGGDLVAIDVIQTKHDLTIRDLTVTVNDSAHIQVIVERIKSIKGVHLVNISDRTFLMHLGG